MLAQWLNSTLRQMWPYYDAAVCATVKVLTGCDIMPSLCIRSHSAEPSTVIAHCLDMASAITRWVWTHIEARRHPVSDFALYTLYSLKRMQKHSDRSRR